MNIFDASNLLWMIPLGGAIVALWMLRLKREDVTVPSLYLWTALLRDNQANTPFQKLRRNILLLLQLLAACLIIFALAKPYVWGSPTSGRTIVFIIDTSASMNATDVSPTRLDEAKSEAEHFVEHDMSGTDVATVIAASSKPSAQIRFTSDKGALNLAIGNLPATDTVADMPAALTLAQSLIGSGAGAQIRIYSDGAYGADADARVDDFNFGQAGVAMIPIGSPDADNVGITAMDGRRDPDTGAYEVFVNVQDFGRQSHDGATLSLYLGDRLVDARPLSFENGTQSETFSEKLLDNGGTVTAKLEGLTDDLAADNSASLVLPPPHRRKVLLVSPGNLFLENGLNLASDIDLKEVSPTDFANLGGSGAGYATVVFDGYLPTQPLGPGNYLIFNAGDGQTPLQPGMSDDNPVIIDQDHTHPVMRYVDLNGLNLADSSMEKTAPWAQSLADTESGSVIAVGENAGMRIVSVGFALSDSDWPLRISFPIFLTNAVDWLTAGTALGPSSEDTPAGAAAALTVPPGLSSLTITHPDGHSTLLGTPNQGGVVVCDSTDQAGLYHAHGIGYDHDFAVNVLDPDESDLTPQAHAGINRAGVKPSSTDFDGQHPRRTRNDLWPAVAAFALVFLTLEWLVYHRRM